MMEDICLHEGGLNFICSGCLEVVPLQGGENTDCAGITFIMSFPVPPTIEESDASRI